MITWRRPLAEINFLGLEFPRQITRTRITPGGRHYAVTRGGGVPKIPSEYLDSVFYLYESEEDARSGERAGGTGFLFSIPSSLFPEQVIYTYAVTNWHNCCKNGASVIRMNSKNGGAQILNYGPEDWVFSSNYDIAAVQVPVDDENMGCLIAIETAITPEDIREGKGADLGVGDEVFMLGRFIDHDGELVNRPAARFGKISIMPAPITQPNGVKADSFCLDMHSRTGFSGSPVFVYRTIGGDLNETAGTLRHSTRGFLRFLGIHWGQFSEYLEKGDGDRVKGLSGMTCVLPAWTIKDVLNMPRLVERRSLEEQYLAKYARENRMPPIAEQGAGAVPSVAPTRRIRWDYFIAAPASPASRRT